LIKINLVREGRAVRGTGAVTGMAAAPATPTSANNLLIVAGLVVGILVAGGWWFLENRKLTDLQEAVARNQAEAQRLEQIIKEVADYQAQKDSLQKRIDLINQLKQNQKGPVRLMDRISQDLPDLVWIDKMNVSGGLVTLDGRGLNPNAIANFVESIKNDPMFEEPDLGNVTQLSSAPLVYGYTMNFHFSYVPKVEAGAGGAAATGTATGTAPATGTAGVPPASTATKR
jgi:Tfp pilus assembly protein PilN